MHPTEGCNCPTNLQKRTLTSSSVTSVGGPAPPSPDSTSSTLLRDDAPSGPLSRGREPDQRRRLLEIRIMKLYAVYQLPTRHIAAALGITRLTVRRVIQQQVQKAAHGHSRSELAPHHAGHAELSADAALPPSMEVKP
jgi:hypothetical protein